MDINLEKIDQIRQRTGVSYKEAKEALERANGDVVEALIDLEEGHPKWYEKLQVEGSELVDRVRQLVREGNVSRVVVKKDDRVLLELPVTVGAIGALLLPQLAVLGVIAAVVGACTIEVERQKPGPRGPI